MSDRKGEARVEGKGAKWRTVPLNAEARKALAAWRAAGGLDHPDGYLRPDPDAPVFVGQRGEGLQPRAVQRVMAALGEQAGLTDLTPHVLRHTCARRLWELLGPDLGHDQALQTIADILGHESLETTRIYTRPKGKDKAAALELLAG